MLFFYIVKSSLNCLISQIILFLYIINSAFQWYNNHYLHMQVDYQQIVFLVLL